ncbi:response regulator [Massilia sp. CF038]|uniref:response regulator n=1 Tax=Massilia sp. CF038 TaxID=1881045 RepID=UPI00092173EF|nr:response regulator [Massilia sp. CF038]SHG64923.1 PAS domain S-box-containing protein [Massilia sp. CF038]
MTLVSPARSTSVATKLGAAVVLVLAAVTLFVAYSVVHSRQRYIDAADSEARNLSFALDNALQSHFQEVDLALRRARQEFSDMHGQARFTPERFSTYLRSLKERMPQAAAVRGADADGMVVYGDEVDPAKPVDLKVREFYQRMRAEPGLVFGIPVRSRISGQMVFPLIMSLHRPDGSFGGSAYVNMNSSHISALTTSLSIGPHGAITLVDRERRLLHRFPELASTVPGKVLAVSAQAVALMDQGGKHASYTAASPLDGETRRFSVRRVGEYPVYVVVGLAERDVLAPWYDETRNAVAFLLVLYLLSAALLGGVFLALRRQLQAVQALSASETRFRSLTEGLPQMVWTSPDARQVDFLSHHWSAYSGVSAAELTRPGAIGKLIHAHDRPRVRAAWQAAIDSGDAFRCDCRLRRHDGAWRVFDNHALPQRAGGAIVGWVGSSTDITEQREAHEALELAKDQALAAGRAKSEFLANMSHEIRSPMNAVLGMLQLLQRTPLDTVQRDYAGKAGTSATALLGILNDILDFSKVEEGKLTLDVQPFSFDKLLRELAVILSANASGKGIEVLFNVSANVPAWVQGDELRLQQVLLNLAGNAIKFTETGEVVLSVEPVTLSDDSIDLHFSVRDTGIGIESEHLAHIFDGFSQAEASTARRFGGTGLGLAISQRLVQLMGGTLSVTSVAGQGSTFEFTIPMPRTDQQHVREISHALQYLRCLVVDDSPTGREVLAAIVRSFGWRADAVATGELALQAVAARPYDLVLVDWRMPGLDGWAMSEQLRRQVPSALAPLVIMVTAHDRELIALTQGRLQPVLDAMLSKPVTASVLFDTVTELRLATRRQVEGTPLAAILAAPVAVDARLAGLRLLVVDDNPVNQQVARELLAACGAEIAVASGGRAAVAAMCDEGRVFDLVLMDIQMPDMDGYAATAAIHARIGHAAPPIVAMTANALSSDRDAAHAAGMAAHVGKPFELERLVDVILRHARRPSVLQPCLNVAAALKRLGGSLTVYQMALRGFEGEIDKLTEQLSNAMEGDHADLGAAALHVMRSLAGMVGADHLAALAQEAEHLLKLVPPVEGRWAAVPAVMAEAEVAVRAAAEQMQGS